MNNRTFNNASLAFMFLLTPIVTHADVVISEFMYDAPGSDDKQEWIELYNNGSADVDLTKWKINDGSNHTLNVPPKNGGIGSIVIKAGGFVILVDDASSSASQFSGSVIDTVLSLPNTNGSIALIDQNGSAADSVSYSKEQGANGDGNTLQRTPSNTFAAAAPTPGALYGGSSNSTTNTNTDTNSTTNTDTNSSSQTTTQTSGQQENRSTTVSSYVAPPVQKIFVSAGKDRDVIAGADVSFKGLGYDTKGNPLPDSTTRYHWTFGDGATAEGQAVYHHFSHPGKYAVFLDVSNEINDASVEVVVTARPVSIEVSLDGDAVVLSNTSGRDLDLSQWHLKSNGLFFTLPEHSTLLANTKVSFPSENTHLIPARDAGLYYPNGTIAAALGSTTPQQEPEITASSKSTPVTKSENQDPEVVVAPETPSQGTSSDQDSTTALSAAAAASNQGGGLTWWIGAATIALLGGGAVYLFRRPLSDDWQIEDISESR